MKLSKIPIIAKKQKKDGHLSSRSSRESDIPVSLSQITSKINEFLDETNSGLKLIPKQANKEMFISIYNAIMNKYPPMFQMQIDDPSNLKKFVDILKIIGYPITFMPSVLDNIGNENQLSKLFYPLYWMIVLIEEDQIARSSNVEIVPEIQMKLDFLTYVHDLYQQYCENHEDQEVLTKISRGIHEKYGYELMEKQQEYLYVQEELENCQQLLNTYNDEGIKTQILEGTLQECQNRYSNLIIEINKLKEEQKEKTSQVDNLQVVVSKQDVEIKDAESMYNAVSKKVQSMKVNPDELALLIGEMDDISSKIDEQRKLQEELRTEITKQGEKVKEYQNYVKEFLDGCNAMAKKLGFEPLNIDASKDPSIEDVEYFELKFDNCLKEFSNKKAVWSKIPNKIKSMEAEKKKIIKEIDIIKEDLQAIDKEKLTMRHNTQRKIREFQNQAEHEERQWSLERKDTETLIQELRRSYNDLQNNVKTKLTRILHEYENL